MKRTAWALLLAGLCAHLPVYADGLPVSPFLRPASVEAMKKQIELDRGAATDDYLVALARAANINILADVTDVPTDPPATPLVIPPDGQNKPPVGAYVYYDLIKQRKLTEVELDERTMMFWPSPDESRLAETIRARHAAAARNDPAPLSDEEANTLLGDYFRNEHDWHGKWDYVDISVPVDDLPAELRAHVQAEIYRSEIGKKGTVASNEWWKTRRLVVAPRNRVPREPLSPFLTTPRERVPGGYTPGIPIGRLDSLANR